MQRVSIAKTIYRGNMSRPYQPSDTVYIYLGVTSFCYCFEHLTKRGYTPKKTLTKRGTLLFADGDVHVLRQIDSKPKSAAFGELPGHLPTIQSFFFFRECIAAEREWSKVGCEQVLFFGMFTRGYTPPSLLNLGSPPFWCDFPPFWHVVDWCTPDWLQNTAGGGLFQLAVVVVRRKDYVPRRNDQRARSAQTWSVISIRDQHTTELGSVTTAYIPWWEMTSLRRELTPVSCFRAARSAPDNAGTDNENKYKSCYSSGPSNQDIGWWHWFVAFGPRTTQPTTQASLLLQGNHQLSVCSRKYAHRWRINMKAKLSLHSRPEWYALLQLHVSYIRRFLGRCSKTNLDPRLSSKRIPNETARRLTVETLKKPTNKTSWVTSCEEIKDTRVLTRLRRARSGLRYPSSSILVSSAVHIIPNFTREH